MSIHKPVLLKEIVEGLDLKNNDIVVDATLGGGGHSLGIINNIFPDGTLVAIDRDESAIQNFEKRLKSLKLKLKKENVYLMNGNFSDLKDILFSLKIFSVNKIIADLGISSDQLGNAQRGFSFLEDAMLDMRMDQSQKITAREVVNKYDEKQLEKILRELGGEHHASHIARAIIKARRIKPIERTTELVSIIAQSVPKKYLYHKIHFATRTFQALRIEVNKELENLSVFLSQAIEILVPGGRLAVISFHSGEDKIVKSIFRQNAGGCICPPEFPKCVCGKSPAVRIVNAKPIVPSLEEVSENPRSRSAKLRVIEKI